MLKICKQCNDEFKPKDKRNIFCSLKCSSDSRKKPKIAVKCTHCGEIVMKYPSQVSVTPFCSRECVRLYKKENHNIKTQCDICGKTIIRKKSHYDRPGNDYCSYKCSDKGFSKFYSGENNPNFLNTYVNCSYCNKEIYRKQSEIQRRKDFFCSPECQCKWQSENIVGERHPNYNKDLSEEDRVEGRAIDGYWLFRKSVYERDEYQCQICGYDKGGTLNAHHLNSFHWDIENRTNPENAITLCEICHKEFHSIYGNKDNTKEQFEEYTEHKAL